jgi:hypothetical protein
VTGLPMGTELKLDYRARVMVAILKAALDKSRSAAVSDDTIREVPAPAGSGWGDLPGFVASQQKPGWKCKTCLVTNTLDANKCPCCDTPRAAPAAVSDNTIRMAEPADMIKRPEEPVVDDWLEGLASTARPVKPKKKGKKGKKVQDRQPTMGETEGRTDGRAASEGEQSDHDNDGFEGNERNRAVEGPGGRLESKGEPPETKAAETVDAWWEDAPAPAPEPKKKGKRGKRKRKGPNRREPEAAGEGEAKGRADGQVAGEGGQSDGDALAADHGHHGGERLASQTGPSDFLPAIEEDQEREPEPLPEASAPVGGEQVASGAPPGPVQQAAVVDELVPESNAANSDGAADEVSASSVTLAFHGS